VAPAWWAVLFGPDGLRLRDWRAQQCVQVVKHGPHRTVERVDLGECGIYVKHYRCTHWWDIVGNLLRGSPARREWERAIRISGRGVSTVRPLAFGELIEGGVVRDSYLITEAIAHSCSIEDYVSARFAPPTCRRDVRARRSLLDDVARFVAGIHRAGIRHDDLHAGNILLSLRGDEKMGTVSIVSQPLREPTDAGNCEPLRFHLIDVSGAQLGPPLPWKSSYDNLVTLVSGWGRRTTRTERLRFWHTYLAERPELRLPDDPNIVARLEADGRRRSRRIARHRDKRATRSNCDYQVIRHCGGRAYGLRQLRGEDLLGLMRQPDALIWNHLDQLVKLSHSGVLVKAALPSREGTIPVAYKCYRPRSWWKSLCRTFGRDRATRSWRLGQALLERGIATARPIAAMVPRRPYFGRRTYLATQWIEGAENLHLYGWRLAVAAPAERLRLASQCAGSLGRLIGRMHSWGVVHGDLKASNVLVLQRDEEIRTYVIDLDDVRITDCAPPRGAAVDLARLAAGLKAHPWVTRTMCCRFLREYAHQFPPGAIDRKRLWRRTAQLAARIAARKCRRGEPVL
jgi:tRNA A-37 threonylcarbamoyl transferase component Bud32